jgi:hypothetical protein
LHRVRSSLHWFALATAIVAVAGFAWAAQPAAGAKRKPAKPVGAAGQERGVNLSLTRAFRPGPSGLSDEENSREIQSACALGARVVRVFVAWRLLEQDGSGQFDPEYAAKLDSLLEQATGCGIKVMITLQGTPLWATSVSPDDPLSAAYPSRNGPGDYQRAASWILARWPGLYALEVWNEPNLPRYWRGTPSEYADLVNGAVAAKRETGSGTLILAGTVALKGWDYLRQLYAAGMRGQDGISLHPYSVGCDPACNPFYDPGYRGAPFRAAIEGIHQVMVENGDPSPLWLTEFGFSTCPSEPACVPDGVQAAWMAQSVRIASCYRYVAGLTAFVLRDRAGVPAAQASDWSFHFGLMGPDFTPKPAFGTVRSTFRELNQASARFRATGRSKRSARMRRATAGDAWLPGGTKCRKLFGRRATRAARR